MPRNEHGSSQPVTKMEPGAADCVMRSRSRLIHPGASLARTGSNGVRVQSVFCLQSAAINAKAVSLSAGDYSSWQY